MGLDVWNDDFDDRKSYRKPATPAWVPFAIDQPRPNNLSIRLTFLPVYAVIKDEAEWNFRVFSAVFFPSTAQNASGAASPVAFAGVETQLPPAF